MSSWSLTGLSSYYDGMIEGMSLCLHDMQDLLNVKYGVLAVVLAITKQLSCWHFAILLTSISWILMGGYYTIYLMYHTLPRDLVVIKRFLCILMKTFGCKRRNHTVVDLFLKTAKRLPNKTMMTYCSENGDTSMTFQECLDKSCQIAHYFQDKGFKKGDIICVMMENRLDYCCYWVGLNMIGVVPALINNNLRQQSLMHTVTVINSKAIIFSSDTQSAIAEISQDLSSETPLFCADSTQMPGATSLPEELSSQSTRVIEERYTGYNEPMVYIYTSGTTGLPKAATVRHSRFLFAMYALFEGLVLNEQEVLYSPLPMYHTAAGLMVTGCALAEGLSTVTRKKFSASQFWKDCTTHNVTAAQYIGEIARYLFATPVSEYEKKHKIRMMFGNGMRQQIWQKFQDRFNISKICEYYGSTEGNCSVSNLTGEKVGAVGFVSVLFPFILPIYVIKIDESTGEPLRGPDGLAIVCQDGEPGELVGRIDKGHPVRDFHGYSDNSSTNKKIMKNVLKDGDMFFRSGDILIKDQFGWIYFKDRAGDTFRWKGENVSTMEVESMVSQVVGQRDCAVFGVEIPGTEGRAGMAVIPDPERKIDLAALHSGLTEKLPSYARPLFIRFVNHLETTGTHKVIKKNLQKEGFNVEEIKDEVYLLDAKSKSYKKLDIETFQNINNGNLRF